MYQFVNTKARLGQANPASPWALLRCFAFLMICCWIFCEKSLCSWFTQTVGYKKFHHTVFLSFLLGGVSCVFNLCCFMVGKCDCLQLKWTIGKMRGKKVLLASGWGLEKQSWLSSTVTVTIICGCSYDTEPDYAFWTNSIWSFVEGKTFCRWSHDKRTTNTV